MKNKIAVTDITHLLEFVNYLGAFSNVTIIVWAAPNESTCGRERQKKKKEKKATRRKLMKKIRVKKDRMKNRKSRNEKEICLRDVGVHGFI